MEALSAEWKRSTRAAGFALVLMDLERFKFVNDFYGHQWKATWSCSAWGTFWKRIAAARMSWRAMAGRVRDPDAGNNMEHAKAAGQQTARLGVAIRCSAKKT